MNDVGGVFPGDPSASHVTGERWMSFEDRMRRRRFGRCLLRADLAIEDGRLDEARTALDEAREVDPLGSGLDELEARLAAVSDVPPVDDPQPTIDVGMIPLASPAFESWRAQPPQPRRLKRRVLIGSVALVGCSLAAAYAARSRGVWPGAQNVAMSTAGIPPLAVANPERAATPPPVTASRQPRLMILREMLSVREAAPRLVEEPLQMPPASGPPIADAANDSSLVRALNRADPPPDPPAAEARRESAPEPALPAVSMPASTGAAVPVVRTEARVEAPAPPPTPDPAPESAPPREPAVPAQTELSMVRAVLEKYEHAYSALDADAASDVWPGVDRTALSRAFDGLARQQVSLGSCDVAVKGAAARVTCSGSATWQPKVGGGLRTEARQWSFDLRKMNGAWRIERALAR